jgi:hypothetical protein
MTTETMEAGAGGPEGSRHSRARFLWLFAALLVLGIAATSVAVVVRHDRDGNQQRTSTQQVAAIEQGCAQWRSSYAGASTLPRNWCAAMAGWMTGELHRGRMMGNTMWSNGERMRATCTQWARNAAATSPADGAAWCDAMVAWMSAHPDD